MEAASSPLGGVLLAKSWSMSDGEYVSSVRSSSFLTLRLDSAKHCMAAAPRRRAKRDRRATLGDVRDAEGTARRGRADRLPVLALAIRRAVLGEQCGLCCFTTTVMLTRRSHILLALAHLGDGQPKLARRCGVCMTSGPLATLRMNCWGPLGRLMLLWPSWSGCEAASAVRPICLDQRPIAKCPQGTLAPI